MSPGSSALLHVGVLLEQLEELGQATQEWQLDNH
jgi:hypothetical protein